MLRAIWHDNYALLREFRLPLLTFLIATLGGGWLYGRLYAYYYPGESFPYQDLPWMMVALMVFEPVHDVPKEPALIVFWYTMPVLAVYVIGQGAVDFVRLFFNRSYRRDAWEEAVAATYRNHVITIGVGHVGMKVIQTLVAMGFDVIAIDQNITEELDQRLNKMGVPSIIGDGRSLDALESAGIRRAASLVVCTSDDHVNLEAIMRARDVNPDIRIVSRMYDPQYSKQLKRFMNVQATLSSSDLSAPAFAGSAVGIEITQTLQIGGTEYSMIRMEVAPGAIFVGKTIDQLQEGYDMDIVLHGRGTQMDVHPDGTVKVRKGDTLVVFAVHSRIMEIVSQNRPQSSSQPQ
jgi:voltage-gated potassium channel